jgi:hypothetical protein
VAGNAWKATSYDPGIGIVLAGNTIQVEDAVIPAYRTGHGAATGNCSPGRDFYLDLDGGDLYYCPAENTWSNLKQGPHTHSAAEITAGTLSSARGGTGTAAPDAHALLVGNGTQWVKAVLPDCASTTGKLLYDRTLQAFQCGTDQAGGGAGSATTEAIWLFTGSSNFGTAYPNTWIIPSTGGATITRLGTAPNMWAAIAFADGSEQRVTTTLGLHPLYQGGLTLTLYWYANTPTAGDVRWAVQAVCSGAGVIPGTAEVPADVATASHASAAGTLVKTSIALTRATCGAGDLLSLRLSRDGAHLNDTLGVNATVYGVLVSYQRGL